MLVEVADAHARTDLHGAGIGLFFAQQAAQQGRLAAAVGADQSPALAANDLQVDLGEQRPLKCLGQPFGADDDIAAARGGRKAHRRQDDRPRHGDQFDAVELLAAVFGLLMLLAVVIAADEVLGLFDLDLLLLERPLLDHEPLGLLRPIGGEIARVAVDGALEKLQGAVRHAVEEVAVVADQQHGRGAFGQERFEPFGGLDVEVVRGLVQEHHVGLGQQQLGQHEPVLLAAAERLDGLVERLAAETQAVQDALDLVVEVVGVAGLHLVLEVVVAVGQTLVFQRVVAMAQLLGHRDQLLFHGHEAGQGALGLVQERAAGLPLGLLFKIADVERRMADDRAAVGLLLVGKDLHERGLAGAVGPDEADALAGAQLERHPVEDRLGAVVLLNAFNLKEDHRALKPPPCSLQLAGGDDLALDRPGHAAILGKFHGEGALALGHAAEVGRVAEGLREGHFALDAADRAADFGGHDHAAAGGQIAHHRTLEVGRTLDLDLHHGLQQHRPGGGEVLPHAGPGTGLEGHVRTVDVVIGTVFQRHLQADHRITGDGALVDHLAEALLNGRNEVLGDSSAGDFLFEDEGLRGVFRQRLHAADDVGVLAGTAGLLLMLGVELAGLGGRLAIVDLGVPTSTSTPYSRRIRSI